MIVLWCKHFLCSNNDALRLSESRGHAEFAHFSSSSVSVHSGTRLELSGILYEYLGDYRKRSGSTGWFSSYVWMYRKSAKITYALSMLLNRALFTSRRPFPFNASVLTSLPMCSPSRSQSVQIKRALAPLAWVSMFDAILLLSFIACKMNCLPADKDGVTNLIYPRVNGRIKESFWRRIFPILDLWPKFSGSQMTWYTSHDDMAVTPWWSEVEGKGIVFDILVPSVGLERSFSWRRCSSSPWNFHLP